MPKRILKFVGSDTSSVDAFGLGSGVPDATL